MVRRGFSPFASVFTRADTSPTTGVRFFPLTSALSTADIKTVRGLMDVRNLTGDMRLQFAFMESDDPELFSGTWAFIDATAVFTADGLWGLQSYATVTLNKSYVVFGVTTRNDSGSPARIEHAWVSARFDTRSC